MLKVNSRYLKLNYLVSGEFIDCEGSGLFRLQSCCKFYFQLSMLI